MTEDRGAAEESLEEEFAVSSTLCTGLGVDIVEISRMEAVLARSPAFAARVFTEGERAYCERHAKPAVHYATHFAAKEAVLKALGTGMSEGASPAEVEVSHDEKGRPCAVLHGRAAEIAREGGIVELPLSLSRTQDTAVANAIALTEASKPAPREKTTSAEKFASRFKELRGMLDELEEPAAGTEERDAPQTGGSAEGEGSSDERG